MSFTWLSTLNALLNLASAVLLVLGYRAIRRGDRQRHKQFMLGALVVSALFLISYVIYHAEVGSVPYPHQDWTRYLYFTILIPHVVLATLMVPFILLAVRRAFQEQFDRHKRIAQRIFPVWLFVSVSGVVVYLMLYHL